MTDKILAALSFITLAAFVATLIIFLVEPDLTVVIVGALALAAYDFHRQIYGGRRRGNG